MKSKKRSTFKFHNGYLFLRIKGHDKPHNQWDVTVVATSAQRALTLIRAFDPFMSQHHFRTYFSVNNDSPPTYMTRYAPFSSEEVWVRFPGDACVPLTNAMLL